MAGSRLPREWPNAVRDCPAYRLYDECDLRVHGRWWGCGIDPPTDTTPTPTASAPRWMAQVGHLYDGRALVVGERAC
jgi:hypothetical protein